MAERGVEAVAQPSLGKKYGVFLGVFTPSILTILGVIMYQRFGWVVGNAGLFGAIGIVLLAHVISVTTGLSVASIATNHRVGTGGNYYMISRSLGLSIGGAIGLALYVALTLGVSLYLIGFAEAFLAAFPGFSPTGDYQNDIRLVGSLACAFISVITLVDTSLALKSQLLVLTLIILSLISIFTGSPIPPVPGETIVEYTAPKDAPSFATVFAVFFPAVTGFTAGVGMSGDLKDPKKAIPWGTMFAIAVGLLIYLTLPVFIAETASVEELRRNNNVLLDIARWPWMVTAGVWAATISSAIGSILGAPRTLQALAFDNIVPKIFGRGKDEPRIALVATIIIAEAGILVAELELVGAVISMFFLTCYGFLCLACGIERWANPDFRPQFKVPVSISLLGALACFMVMSQINFMAMIGAIVIMLIIFLVLKRRQLGLGRSDAWGSLWSAVVRAGLLGLRRTNVIATQDNWRPNMILMSRSGNTRSQIIEFARDMVGKQGILTHFELERDGPPRARVDEQLESEYTGMFARVQGTENVFKSIPDIAANFGFVGMETNVIMLGWPRDVEHNEVYARMLRRLVDLDLSVLMLRLDTKVGFGSRERIDIWWDGIAPTGPLMLTIAHLLTSSADWKNAKIRLLVNGRKGMDEGAAKKRLRETVASSRLKAEPILLSALADQTLIAERIRKESAHADLVMIHALEPEEGHEKDFVVNNNELLNPVGTTLLVRPSSAFTDATVIFDNPEPVEESPTIKPIAQDTILVMPDREELAPSILLLESQLQEAAERFRKSVQHSSIEEEKVFVDRAIEEVSQLRQLDRRLARRGTNLVMCRGLLDWGRNRYGSSMIELTTRFTETSKSRKVEGLEGLIRETLWQRRFREGLSRLQQDLRDILVELPLFVSVQTVPADWEPKLSDSFRLRVLKTRVRLAMSLFGTKPPSRRVYLRDIVEESLTVGIASELSVATGDIGYRRFEVLTRLRSLYGEVARFFQHLNDDLDNKSDSEFNYRLFGQFFTREFEQLEDVARDTTRSVATLSRELTGTISKSVQSRALSVVDTINRPEVILTGRAPTTAGKKQLQQTLNSLELVPERWERLHTAQANAFLLDVQMAKFKVTVRRVLTQTYYRIQRELEAGPLSALSTAHEILEKVRELRESLDRAESTAPEEDKSEADSELTENEHDNESLEDESRSDSVGPPDPVLVEQYLKAADELRATWEEPYRPRTREIIEQMVLGLGRAGDQLPVSVVTLGEKSLDSISDRGDLPQSEVNYPVRRLAQNFLENSIAQPSANVIRELSEKVQMAQNDLVDAVRLVAFDIEQQGQNLDRLSEEEPEIRETLALDGMISERMTRLTNAQDKLNAYITELRSVLLTDAFRALADVRAIITASSLPLSGAGAQVLDIRRAQGQFKRRLSKINRRLKRRAKHFKDKFTRADEKPKKAKVQTAKSHTLVDEFIMLRNVLFPSAELQNQLPLIYKRVFGRMPLENIDLMKGRASQIEELRRSIDRWENGMGGPLAILGEPRSGKSTLVSIAVKELLAERTVVRVQAPLGGSSDPDKLRQAIVKAVGGREGQSAEIALRAMPPGAVLVIDGLGRWLERSHGGLAAIKLWRQLWRRLGERHLFIVTATPYTWDYVRQLCGLDQGFLSITWCDAVSSKELKELILLRQRTSDFELELTGPSSKRRRRAAGWNDQAQLRRLHTRSKGNIGVAIDIWRQNIVGVTERKISVSIPESPDISILERIPVKWSAALAAIAIHESVSPARMSRIMRCTKEEASGLLADMERSKLIMSERSGANAFVLDAVMQPHVMSFLEERNILQR